VKRAVGSTDAPLAFQDYVLHQHLGAGATGKVYRATHKSNGQQVAVKYLKKSFIRVPEVVARFVKEAATLSRLRHPGFVAVHKLGRTPIGGFFIVMDLLDGGDLNRRLNTGPVAVEDAVRWVREAAAAIAYAHQHGIVHCDLKPSNLLLDRAGRVYVTDFGLALSLNDRNDARALAGTPAFMAPEQVDDTWGDIGPHTDVYGLGAVLYTLLVGRPPFAGRRADAILARVASKRPIRFPGEARKGLPQDVIAICERCLAKQPADRFASAIELAAVLSETTATNP
jgi:serine/threonine protein kinase